MNTWVCMYIDIHIRGCTCKKGFTVKEDVSLQAQKSCSLVDPFTCTMCKVESLLIMDHV